ncbi:hypothetical protein CSOJ01_00829 [Colletotrichum sojae]|uniref:Uncharacterized protein n=1 Tax=Colletotrichum sojae TaxID=2175907 RepID=A0A8H6JX47_9PEZI|nr:hypothetical protein CSOJ01_00829 [Colletotrichum sojae]
MDRNPTSPEQPPPRYTASKPIDASRQRLRHSRRPVYILTVYLLLLLLPWICICVVNRRTTSDPLSILTRHDFDAYRRWMMVAPFLSTVAAVIAVPSVSALLAHGAVVYSQRRSHQQSLSLRQLLALSDVRWTAVFAVGETSTYLLLATGLLLLAALQVPLQSLLMPMSSRVVYPCESSRRLTKWDHTCNGPRYHAQKVGNEPELASLREFDDVPRIVDTVRAKLADITSADIQDNLWRELDNHRSFLTGNDQKYDDNFWVSAIPAGSTTGPLRQHSMRINSTADCQAVSSEEFPGSCSYSTSLEGFGVAVKTCMPENPSDNAVKRSSLPPRRRQDVEETLFISAKISPEASQTAVFLSDPAENVTIKCVAKTTRAFFELGNFHTDLVPSEIVNEWPTDDEMKAHFHDYDWLGNLITKDWEAVGVSERYAGWTSTRGPLRTTAEALFGQGSFPEAVFEILSETFPSGHIPDTITNDDSMKATTRNVCSIDTPLGAWQLPYNFHNEEFDAWYPSIYKACSLKKLPHTVFRVAQGLRHRTVAQSTLGVGMYLSNAAVLMNAASNDAARTIFNLTGTDFVAPQHSLGAVVALSTLISIQAMLLVLLVCYIYSSPTWTNTLDAFAMLRIGAQLNSSVDLPPLGHVTKDELSRLGNLDGLIGTVPGTGFTPDEDLELAAMPSSSSTARGIFGPTHQYDIIRPTSPASTVSSLDLPAEQPRAQPPSQDTTEGMTTNELSSYLQGGGLGPPSVSSVASSVRSASPPPPYLPAGEDQSTQLPYQLSLGAPGVITGASWRRNRPQ